MDVPSVAELPTSKKMASDELPLITVTDDAVAVVSVLPDLEQEQGVGRAAEIERQVAGKLRRRRKEIHARRERAAAQVHAGEDRGGRETVETVERREGVALRLLRNGIAGVHRPEERDASRAGDRRAGIDTEVSLDRRRSGVGDGGGTEHAELLSRAERALGDARRTRSRAAGVRRSKQRMCVKVRALLIGQQTSAASCHWEMSRSDPRRECRHVAQRAGNMRADCVMCSTLALDPLRSAFGCCAPSTIASRSQQFARRQRRFDTGGIGAPSGMTRALALHEISHDVARVDDERRVVHHELVVDVRGDR